MKKIEVLGLQNIPQIKQGDNLAEIIIDCADGEIGGLKGNTLLHQSLISSVKKHTITVAEINLAKGGCQDNEKTDFPLGVLFISHSL